MELVCCLEPCLCAPGQLTCEDVLESKFDVAGVKGGGFDERKVVLACSWSVTKIMAPQLPGDA
jgi:hypothetical protein